MTDDKQTETFTHTDENEPFLRRTSSRKLADGTCYTTYRLVASERVDGKVRQRTLLNLGAHFALEREQWPLLCTRIEQLLEGKHSF